MLPVPENLLTPYVSRRHPLARGAGGGWFDLDDWVGPGHPSTRPDIAKLEAILANSGDFPMERFQGPTGYWGGALDAGIRSYQKRNGLKVDGALRPGGPTISHMRDSFANLFDGYEPPTPDDIDAHQNIVGDDNPGTIAWRRPDVSFAGIPGLPEIDQEADASNARLVRAMLRTGDIEGYAQLMRDAIDQGGKHGLAEVRDLTLKLDEASPGLGTQFGGYIYEGMTKAQRDAHDLKAQGGQPLGTVQVAMLRPDGLGNIGGRPEIGNEGARGGGIGLAGGLSLTAAAQYLKEKFTLPGFTPADNENKPVQTPPEDPTRTRPGYEEIPTTIAGPTHTGHPADLPDMPNALVNVPEIPKEERDALVNEIVDQVFPNELEYRYKDGRFDWRGGPLTIKSNNIGAKKLKELIEESDCPEFIKHVGGASQDGNEAEYLKERIVEAASGRKRRADISARFTDPNTGAESEIHANTVTTDALGNPIPRETDAAGDMAAKIGDDRFGVFRKLREGEDEEEYGRQFKEVLRQKIQPLINECRKSLGR